MYILRELWTKDIDKHEVKFSYKYVLDLRERLGDTVKLAQEQLELFQAKQKRCYDKRTNVRRFQPDDAALTTHKEEELQQLISQFSHTCKEFGLTISFRKTKVMGRDVPSPPSIIMENQVLEVADHFTYLGLIISSNLSLDSEINKRIAKASSVMARLSKRVWSNNQLTTNTKLQVYQACVLSALPYGSESWTTYARQENRLKRPFHLLCLGRILGITWQDKVTNTAVLGRAGSHSIHLLLCRPFLF